MLLGKFSKNIKMKPRSRAAFLVIVVRISEHLTSIKRKLLRFATACLYDASLSLHIKVKLSSERGIELVNILTIFKALFDAYFAMVACWTSRYSDSRMKSALRRQWIGSYPTASPFDFCRLHIPLYINGLWKPSSSEIDHLRACGCMHGCFAVAYSLSEIIANEPWHNGVSLYRMMIRLRRSN